MSLDGRPGLVRCELSLWQGLTVFGMSIARIRGGKSCWVGMDWVGKSLWERMVWTGLSVLLGLDRSVELDLDRPGVDCRYDLGCIGLSIRGGMAVFGLS